MQDHIKKDVKRPDGSPVSCMKHLDHVATAKSLIHSSEQAGIHEMPNSL